MNVADLFVAAVAVTLGAGGVAVALFNADAYFRPAKIRWIERIAGRAAARALYAVFGVALIAIGVAIALGGRS